MANEFCTGAVHIYVQQMGGQPTTSTAIGYLGTCENFPERQTERSYKNLQNDLSSQRAFDYVYAGGSEAVVSLVLTRWNESVALTLERAPVSGLVGADHLNDIGSLMFQEKLGWRLLLVNQFGTGVAGGIARPTMVGQENGRRYVASLFWGPERFESGTKEAKKHMVFRCGRLYDPATQKFTLWDGNISGVPAPD